MIFEERDSRILLDSTLNNKIDNENKLINLELGHKANKTDVQNQVSLVSTVLNQKIDLQVDSLNQEVNSIQLDLQNQKSKLNNLLLGTQEFQEKLNILTEMESLDTLTSLIDKIDTFEQKIIQAQLVADEASTLVTTNETEILNKIQDTRDLIFKEKVDRDQAITSIEETLSDLKLHVEGSVGSLKTQVAAFQEKINTDVLSFSDLVTNLNDTLGTEYQKVHDKIKAESNLRENNNKIFDVRLNKIVDEFNDKIAEVDSSDSIIALKKQIQDQNTLIKVIKDGTVISKQETTQELNNLRNIVSNNYSNNLSRIDNESNTRTQAINAINLKLDNEITQRISDVRNLGTSFETLKAQILGGIVDGTNLTQTEKETLLTAFDTFDSKILTNYNDILTLRNTVAALEIDLETQVTALNDTIGDKETLIRLELSTEVNNRSTELQAVNTAVTNLQNTISTISGIEDISQINLETLNTKIEDFNNTSRALNTATINDFQNITDALELRIYNLELGLNTVVTQLDNETGIREADNIALNTKIDSINSTITSTINNLQTSLAEVESTRAQDKVELELLIQQKHDAFEVLYNTKFIDMESDVAIFDDRLTATESTISTSIDNITTTVNEVRDNLTAEVDARVAQDNDLLAQITSEIQTRILEDDNLRNLINIEKGRLDTILAGSTVDLDSFAEIITFINDLKVNKEAVLDDILGNISTLRRDYENALESEETTRVTEDGILNDKIVAEATIRADEDTALNTKIDTEITNRINEVQRLDSLILAKEIELKDLINTTNDNINTTNQELIRIENEYKASDDIINITITNTAASIRTDLTSIQNSLQAVDNQIKDDILSLSSVVNDNYTTLDAKINTNTNNFIAFLAGVPIEDQNLLSVYNKIQTEISNLSTITSDADANINTRIDSLTLDLNKEINTRISETQDLTSQLQTEIQNRILGVESLQNALQTEIDARLVAEGIITQDLLNEITSREAEVQLLTTNLNSEVNIRVSEVLTLNNRLQAEETLSSSERGSLEFNINLNKIDSETGMATVPQDLTTAINNENSRAEAKENELNIAIVSEESSRKVAIASLSSKIDDEISRAISKDNTIETLALANKAALDSILLDSSTTANSFKELSDIIEVHRVTNTTNYNNLNNKIDNIDGALQARINIEETTRTSQNLELIDKLTTEVLDRRSGDNNLNQSIEGAKAIAAGSDQALNAKIEQETINRNTVIESTNTKIDAEINTRTSQDNLILSKIDTETTARTGVLTTYGTLLETLNIKNTELLNNLSTEIINRQVSEAALNDRIDQVTNIVQTILNGVDDSYNDYAAIINLIKSIDITADTTLANFAATTNEALNQLTTNLTNEINTRLSQDNAINSLIVAEGVTRANDILNITNNLQTEINNRLTAIGAIDTRITNEVSNLNANINTNINTLRTLIDNLEAQDLDTSNRITTAIAALSLVDTDLQSSIDSLEAQLDSFKSTQEGLIAGETANRIENIRVLDEKINAEINTRTIETNTLTTNLTNEINNRIAGDSAINDKIIRETEERILELGIADSKVERIKSELNIADTTLNNKIDAVAARTEAILAGTEINLAEFQDIVNIINNIDRENDILTYVQNSVDTATTNLTNLVNTTKTDWEANLTSLNQNLTDLINLNKLNTDQNRTDLENYLTGLITQNTSNLTTEVNVLNTRIVNESLNRQDHINAMRVILENANNKEIQDRIAAVHTITQGLALEVSDRQAAVAELDVKLSNDLNTEIQNRINDVNDARSDINAEEVARIAAINALNTSLDTLNTLVNNNKTDNDLAITNEEATRKAADGTLVFDISLKNADNSYVDNITDAINAIVRSMDILRIDIPNSIEQMIANGAIVIPSQIDKQELVAEIKEYVLNDITEVLNNEEAARITADTSLDNKYTGITDELKTRIDSNDQDIITINNTLVSNKSYTEARVDNEATAREAGDAAINAIIESNENNRDLEIETINKSITNNTFAIANTTSDLSTHKTNFEAYKVTISDDIDSRIAVEIGRATLAETTLQDRITTEVNDRTAADLLLQTAIDTINAKDINTDNTIAAIQTQVDSLLAGTTEDLNSLQEIINYINTNDTSILTTITNFEEAVGLTANGLYVADVLNHYTNTATSIRNSIDILDAALKSENDRTDSEILLLTQNLATEVQNRIDLESTLNTTITNLDANLRALITDNTTRIDNNSTRIETNQQQVNQEIVNLKAADNALTAEIATNRISVGLEPNGSYEADTTTTYLGTTVSLKDALKKLDTALKAATDSIGDISTLTTTVKTTVVDAINEVKNDFNTLTTAENELDFDNAFLVACGITPTV
jgi:hypothetical protein